MADGDYTVRVASVDVAGNETFTDYDFVGYCVTNTAIAQITLQGVNSGTDLEGDGVLNRAEIGMERPALI